MMDPNLFPSEENAMSLHLVQQSSQEEEFERLNFEGAPRIVVKPPGPASKVILDEQKKLDSNAIYYPIHYPAAFDEGRGCTLKDLDGNLFLDLIGASGVLSLGNSHPVIIEAITKQLNKLASILDCATVPRIELLKRLHEIAPGGLRGMNSKVLLGSPTGTDAVEAALKLARSFTGKQGILTFQGGYHGQTVGALAVSSKTTFRSVVPMMPLIYSAPFPYTYRWPFGNVVDEEDCKDSCLNYIDYLLTDPDSGIVDCAAVIIEPIQGEGGVTVPPKGFMKELQKICNEKSVLLIVDEVQTGLARTGKMWACEYDGVTPDIMCMGKGLSGTGIINAGIIYKKELDTWKHGAHVGSNRGSPLACATSCATIDYIRQQGLVERSEKIGNYILNQLQERLGTNKFVGEIRGRGLLLAIELVLDKKTKKPATELTEKIMKRLFERGVMVEDAGHFANCLRLIPPLTIPVSTIDSAMEIIEDVVKEVGSEIA
jgi:diaminobutyrate-2-oxoglutarate transaminase